MGLYFFGKASLVGLFLGEFTFGGAYYWREFCVSKWAGLDNKNSSNTKITELKQQTVHGHTFGRISASEIWGGYFREGLFLEGLIIGISQYKNSQMTYSQCEAQGSYPFLDLKNQGVFKDFWVGV